MLERKSIGNDLLWEDWKTIKRIIFYIVYYLIFWGKKSMFFPQESIRVSFISLYFPKLCFDSFDSYLLYWAAISTKTSFVKLLSFIDCFLKYLFRLLSFKGFGGYRCGNHIQKCPGVTPGSAFKNNYCG